MQRSLTLQLLLTDFGGLFQKHCRKDADTLQRQWRERQEQGETLADFLTFLFHECLTCNDGLNKAEILFKNREVYLAMGRFVRDYQDADPNPYIRLSFEAELQYYRQLELAESMTYRVEICAEADSCHLGASLDGTQDTIPAMQRAHPLASEECTRKEGCICAYALIPGDNGQRKSRSDVFNSH